MLQNQPFILARKLQPTGRMVVLTTVPKVKFDWESIVVVVQGNVDLRQVAGSDSEVPYCIPIGPIRC